MLQDSKEDSWFRAALEGSQLAAWDWDVKADRVTLSESWSDILGETRRATVTMAEGEKASAILRAEGEKQSKIVSAEGEKQSAILTAEGQAEARLKVAAAEAQAIAVITESIGTSGNPTQYLIAQKYLESLNQIAKNADKTVFLPYEATGVMGALGGMKELLKNT